MMLVSQFQHAVTCRQCSCHSLDVVPCIAGAEWLAELAPHFYSKKDLQSAMTTKMPKVVGRAAIDAQ